MMDDPSGRPPAGGVARRRRERRLRAQLRHEQQTVRMVLATVTHHSFQVGTAHDGLRAQKTVTSTREVEERVPHAGLRAQKAPPPGMRPGVLQDPAPQGRVGQHSGIGYELVLALDVPVLQMVEQPVDASALAFLEEVGGERPGGGVHAAGPRWLPQIPRFDREDAGGHAAEARAPPEGSREEEEEEEEEASSSLSSSSTWLSTSL